MERAGRDALVFAAVRLRDGQLLPRVAPGRHRADLRRPHARAAGRELPVGRRFGRTAAPDHGAAAAGAGAGKRDRRAPPAGDRAARRARRARARGGELCGHPAAAEPAERPAGARHPAVRDVRRRAGPRSAQPAVGDRHRRAVAGAPRRIGKDRDACPAHPVERGADGADDRPAAGLHAHPARAGDPAAARARRSGEDLPARAGRAGAAGGECARQRRAARRRVGQLGRRPPDAARCRT